MGKGSKASKANAEPAWHYHYDAMLDPEPTEPDDDQVDVELKVLQAEIEMEVDEPEPELPNPKNLSPASRMVLLSQPDNTNGHGELEVEVGRWFRSSGVRDIIGLRSASPSASLASTDIQLGSIGPIPGFDYRHSLK
ncbi:hypothetical protein NM208_g5732 [Fusarium decemcellulare]|uniref:Uncharacterized protein n=1 Tax=Fusarium decemcellulare TaxID=57161 RepID=A0ACC1SFQ5_9HYPO|nr:hypothetical protein NM208_g5732 [Fusarium decemcellulare]